MNNSSHRPPKHCNVAVVGGGPAGLATATELKKLGVANVVVLERESKAGGIPTHCGHSPFGVREFGRCYAGPQYAKRLVNRAHYHTVDLYTNTTVVSAAKGGKLTLTTPHGMRQLQANVVVLSTGARETPRAARLVSGQRPLGIVTTGGLQSMVYLKGQIPFRRPVIVGTELVSFSSLLTCRHANIKPVAMLEQNRRITAWAGSGLLPKLLGIPVHFETEIVEIMGTKRVTGVRIINAMGEKRDLKCDGVIFTGKFIPESTLMRMGHLEVDSHSGGPVVDQFSRCSDPTYFATGNLLRPIETASWCWREGVDTARFINMSMMGKLCGADQRTPITFTDQIIKYIVPQNFVTLPNDVTIQGMKNLQLRFSSPARGYLSIRSELKVVWSKLIDVLPERRILLPLTTLLNSDGPKVLVVEFNKI